MMGRFWADLYHRVDSTFKAHPGDDPAHVQERIALRDSICTEARSLLVQDIGPQLRTISPRALERLRRAVQVIIAAAKENQGDPFAAVRGLALTPGPNVGVPRTFRCILTSRCHRSTSN